MRVLDHPATGSHRGRAHNVDMRVGSANAFDKNKLHVQRKQVPAHKAGKLAAGRLRRRRGQALTRLRAVVLVHRAKLRNVAMQNAGEIQSEPVRLIAIPIATQGYPVEQIRVDPDRPAPVRVRLDNRLVVVVGIVF